MTVSSSLNRKTYTGDGVTTSFATTPVVFFDTSDLTVYVVTTATGASTTLTENTHYTVSGGDGAVGTVSLAGGSSPYGAPSASQTVVIVRELDIVQEFDPQNNDGSDADALEQQFDKVAMQLQQLDAAVSRAFALADSDVSGASTTLPTPAASKLIGWDSNGTALTNYASASIVDTVVPTAFAETILDDADGEQMFQTLVDSAAAETAPAAGDLILISDVSLTPDDGRKMTLENALKVINGLTADGSPDATADYVATYDASDAAAKKVLLQNVAPQATTSLAGKVELATSAEVIAATDSARVAALDVLHHHPGVAKAWGHVTHATTVNQSYPAAGVSVNNSGTGVYVVTHGRTMSSTTYPVVITPQDTTARVFSITAQTATTFTLTVISDAGAAEDLSAFSYAVYGALA